MQGRKRGAEAGVSDQGRRGGTVKNKLLWPVTAVVCALVLSVGIYLGLRDDSATAGKPALSPVIQREYAPGGRDAVETTVYVTRTGACYHRAGCSYLGSSSMPMPLSQAKQRYRPCSRCNPAR